MGKELRNKLLALSVLVASLTMVGCAGHTPYVQLGAGYKPREANIEWKDGSTNHPISARIELGFDNGPWSYGYSHHSQWFTGWPVNSDSEYFKDEIFIDYKWSFIKE